MEEIKTKKVKFVTIKDADFGEIKVEKSLIDFLNEPVKNYLKTFNTYTGMIIDFGTENKITDE
jgi:hypothetical protein